MVDFIELLNVDRKFNGVSKENLLRTTSWCTNRVAMFEAIAEYSLGRFALRTPQSLVAKTS